MKKNFLFLALFFLGFAEIIFGQKVTETAVIQATLTSIEQITIGTDASTYDENGSYEIGMEGDSVAVVVGKDADGKDIIKNKYRKRIYRTFCEFVLTSVNYTSTNHTVIKKVDVEYSTGGFGHTFKITNPNSKPTSSSEKWSTVGTTSTALFSGITYSGSTINSSSGLVSAVQNGLPNNHLYLGLASESESTSGSNADVYYITLKITYERDRQSIAGTVQNDLYSAPAGKIYVDGILFDSPHAHAFYEGSSYTLKAYSPQDHTGTAGTYTYIWHEGSVNTSKWIKQVGTSTTLMGSTPSVSYTTNLSENGAVFTAYMKRICNLDFKNNLVGFSSYGSVTVNGTSYNSPTSQFPVVEANAITVTATSMYSVNGITYYFSQWNDGSTANPRTFYPTLNASYTANFVGIPNSTYMNITLNYSESGQPVRLSWNDHPNANVTQYKVYRGAKVEGNFTNPVVLATLNRGTTSYTDYNYIVGGSNPGSVAYDVVPYYATENTWGYLGQNIITASPSDLLPKMNENALAQETAAELPTKYSISNFPNPFNPTTTIKYQLPEAGFVTLKVYDILGREVAELVNETKAAGYYEISFDASRLTSGVYIYTIQAGKYTESKKMILAK